MEENSKTINFDMPAEAEEAKEKKSNKAAYAAAATGVAGAAAGASAVAAGAAIIDDSNADEIILTDEALDEVADVASASAPHSFASNNIAQAHTVEPDIIADIAIEPEEIVYDTDQIILTEEPDIELAIAQIESNEEIQIAYEEFQTEELDTISEPEPFDTIDEPSIDIADDLLAGL